MFHDPIGWNPYKATKAYTGNAVATQILIVVSFSWALTRYEPVLPRVTYGDPDCSSASTQFVLRDVGKVPNPQQRRAFLETEESARVPSPQLDNEKRWAGTALSIVTAVNFPSTVEWSAASYLARAMRHNVHYSNSFKPNSANEFPHQCDINIPAGICHRPNIKWIHSFHPSVRIKTRFNRRPIKF